MMWQARKVKPKQEIALLGWHGEGAIGDDLLGMCVRRLLTDEGRSRDIAVTFTSDPNNCDLIVIGGGTLLGRDSMGLYKRLLHAKAPLVFFGGGFRRETRKLSDEQRDRMRSLIGRASLAGVRGYTTQQFFVHNGIDAVEVIGDPAWIFEPVTVPDFKPGFKLGLVVRNMGKTGEPQYVGNRQVHECIAQAADYLIERFDAKPYFFSFAENAHDSDTEGAKETMALMRRADAAEIIPMGADPLVAGSLIGKMDYLVSQRLHPAVLAWIQGKPCVAFEYQFGKTADCMNSIGMDEFVIRTDEFSLAAYQSKFERLWAERALVAEHAARSIAFWRARLRSFAGKTLDLMEKK